MAENVAVNNDLKFSWSFILCHILMQWVLYRWMLPKMKCRTSLNNFNFRCESGRVQTRDGWEECSRVAQAVSALVECFPKFMSAFVCFRINNVLALKHEKEDFDGDTNVKIRNRTVVQPSSNKTATTGELIRTGRWKWKFYWVWMVVHIYPRTLTRPVGIQTR